MGYAYLWEFMVAPEHAAEFERVYGPGGPWVALFRQSAGYLGTSLLRDRSNPLRFVTLDRWRDESGYREFRTAFALKYRELDERCRRLTSGERALGSYDESED
ncbi:MAG TPA: antibiotic biosynthesis monooxygenase family protein [Steroidobacteraceae bacterium]|jgi:quinol monooxygenase YgiN